MGRSIFYIAWHCWGIVLAGLLLAVPAWADKVPYRQYTVADGLPHGQVVALAQTPDGRLWIGTRGGLAVYDGERFNEIALLDSLGSVYVHEVVPQPDGSVWVAVGGNGAMQVRAGRVVRAVLTNESVRRILVQGDTVHFATYTALWTLPPGADQPTARRFLYPIIGGGPALRPNDPDEGWGVYDAALSPEGRIWVLDRRLGPGRLQPDGSVSFVGAPLGRQGDAWADLRVTAQGKAVCTRGNDVYQLDLETGALTKVFEVQGAWDLYVADHVAYVAANEGVVRWDLTAGQQLPPLGATLGLPTNYMRSTLRDREGGLWVGTENGLLHLFALDVRHIDDVEGVPCIHINNFAQGPDGTLWTPSYGMGLFQVDPEPRNVLPGGGQAWGPMPRSLDGRLYALGAAGWYRYRRGGAWRRLAPQAEAVYGFVDAQGVGYFWHDDGLFRHDPGSGEPPQPLVRWPPADRFVHAIAPAPDGDVILRSRDVLLRIDTDAHGTTPIDTLALLSGYDDVGATGHHLSFDRRARAWLALPGHGLLLVETAGEAPRQRLLLPGRSVDKTYLSGDSLVFASGADGLFILDAAGGAVRHHLTFTDGLASNNVIAAAIHGDVLYTTHPNGISTLPLHVLYHRPSPPDVLLTRITRRGRAVDRNAPARFGRADREVSFSFAAPYFRQPEQVRYEYRLVPYETQWRTSEQATERYTNLRPGSYRFEVRARLQGGAPGEVVAYAFVIPPFFYETWWFAVVCGVLLLAIAAGAYRWRVRSLKARQRDLETVVSERTQQLREQARRLAELDEAKSRFFANVSHEFRTPLTLITGPLEEGLPDDPNERERLEGMMLQSARRLLRLVNQLLDLARLESGQMTLRPEPGDLAVFLCRLVRAFQPMAECKQIALHYRADRDALPRAFDRDKLEKIVGNLLANALTYTPRHGKVWVALSTSATDDQVEITVKDTGPGIPPEALPHVFERFRQADDSSTRTHEGTGIGLALAKELVELHDGQLFVESEPGFGSAFTVRLSFSGEREVERAPSEGKAKKPFRAGFVVDAEREPATVETPEPERDPASNGDRPTILIVEDNAEVRALVRSYLEPSYRIVEAADGQAGLETARREQPDLVVADVMMPELDGLALVEALKADEALGTAPVILLTARASKEDTVAGLEAGADDYLAKPFSAAELRARVARHLKARQRLRAQYSREVVVQPTGVALPSEDEAFLEQIQAVVEERMGDERFGVGDLAEAVGLSPRQLRRRLRALLDESPAALLRRMRLERAAQLLAAQASTVAEVAYRVGFKNADHFSTAFRKHFGHTPTEHFEKRS